MEENQKHRIKKGTDAYMKYSGIAFQMTGMVLAGIFLGKKLDEWLQMEVPIFTVLLILVFFGGYMYKLYIELTKKPDN